MEKKVEHKLEGDMLIVSMSMSDGVDSDKDGVKSVEVEGSFKAKIDGSEALDELFKSNNLVQKAAEKLKALGII